jgi:outer membrane protein assembly factor BamB
MKKSLIVLSLIVIIGVIYFLFFFSKSSEISTGSVSLENSQPVSEWREESRTGVSAETGLLKSWPDEGPAMVWSNNELPKGFSSPSFGNNRIYITGQDNDNDILISLDNTGKILWKTPYGGTWKASYPESRCTPTVEGNTVYVSSGHGDIACIDGTSGSIIWSVKASELYKGTFGEWGIAESLIIDGRKLYFSPGGPETMTIGLDKNTGNLIWKSESINDGPTYVSPVLIEFEGKKLIINISLHYVYGVDATEGKILWKLNHQDIIDPKKSLEVWQDAPLIKCVSPLYNDGKIYITGGYNHGSALLKLAEGGSEVSVEWTEEVLDVHHGGVVLINGYIYGSNWLSNNDGNWCCIEWATGKKMYEESWKCKGSIISAEGLLYVYDERSGFVGLVKPDPAKFDIVSSFKINKGSGPHWAHPVVFNGILYIRHGEALMAYDIKESI